jgi:hypothetical protein
MSPNKAITVKSALPILVDCAYGEKENGVATWAGNLPRPKAVRLFNQRDAAMHRKTGKKDRLEALAQLIAAMTVDDKEEIVRWQKELDERIDTENAANRKYDLHRNAMHYRGWAALRAYAGVKGDQERWYRRRRDRRRKLYGSDAHFSSALRDLGLEVPLNSPPPLGRKGSKEREERKNYDRQFKKEFREMERKLDEILAGERLAPSLENEITLSHWQLSKLLSEAKLVLWHDKKSFQPALYCGGDLDVAYWAYVFTNGFLSLSSKQALCEGCGIPFLVTISSKTHCNPNCQAAHGMRRKRKRERAKREREKREETHS